MASLRALTIREFVYKFKGLERLKISENKKSYSVFPSTYIKPIYRKGDQEELEKSGQLANVILQPVKPAFTNETSSEFHDTKVCKFTNYIMREGKKILARKLLHETFTKIKRIQLEKYNKSETLQERSEIELDPVKILHRAVDNAMPVLELVKLRKGGVYYQVPHPVTAKRSLFLGMNWLLQAAKDKGTKVHLPDTLSTILIDTAYNTGAVVKRKQELYKQCEANRAYAHFRWR